MSRDRTVGDTFFVAFTTRSFSTGAPATLAGTPVISAYEDAGLTQITAGLTLGVDHDAVTGLNMITVVATGGNGFETGKDYQLVITTGTVGGVSVVGEVVGEFSLDLSAALKAVDLLNDVAATDIVSAGAITTSSGSVSSVTTVATTTTNSDMRGTDSAATAANLATVDTNVDSILVDTGTTIPAQISALNDVAATDIVSAGAITTSGGAVSNVTTVATTTTNTDMRGTDSAATAANLATVDTNVDAILVDTGTTLPAQITALNDVAATDIVSAGAITTLSGAVVNVDLVDTTTTNSDMRGTNSALLAADINLTAGAVDNVTTVATTTTNTDMRGTDSALLAASINLTAGAVDTVTDVTNQVTANTTSIAGNATSATNLSKSAIAIEPGAAIAGTLSTTQMTTDLTEATDDHYNGRIIVWTTGALKNQATDITDYTGATKLLTFTATTEAPGIGDEFVII